MPARESYVRPVLRAREPRPEWIAIWRFRLAAFVVLVLLTLLVVYLYNHFVTGANRQDPSFDEALRGPVATAPPAGGS